MRTLQWQIILPLLINLLFGSTSLFSQNYALQFQNSNRQYIDVPYTADLNMNNAMTIECWVKPSNQYRSVVGILHKMGNGVGGWSLTYYKTLRRFTVHISDGKTTHELHSSPDYPPEKYYHLAITYNRAKGVLRLFVNGNVTEKGGFTTGVLATNSNLYIGASMVGGKERYFSGKMDEVRIWNYDKTAEEINQSGFSELSGSEPGLMAYFNFNQLNACGKQDYGEALLDASQQKNNGYFRNFDSKAFPKSGALQFDGIDDHISIPLSSGVFIKNKITVECWVQSMLSPVGNRQAIIGKSYPSNVGGWGLLMEDEKFVFEIADGENRTRITSKVDIKPGSWYHLAATYNREEGVMHLLVNGQLTERTELYTGLIYAPHFPLEFGKYPIQAVPFKGAVREIRVWNIAKSLNQIRQDANRKLQGNESGLMGDYRLNLPTSYGQRTIGQIADASVLHHSGLLKGFNLDKFQKNPCDSIWVTDVPFGINDLIQDDFGWLWLATNTGLFKYDGIYYQSFFPSDSIEKKRVVTRLIPGKKSWFWVETTAGLYVFDLKQESFTLVKKKKDIQTWTAVSGDHSGGIWIASNSGLERIVLYEKTRKINEFIVLKSEIKEVGRVNKMLKGQDENLWVGTDSGLFKVKISASESGTPSIQIKPYLARSGSIQSTSVYHLAHSKNGFWLAGRTQKGEWLIEHFDRETENFTALKLDSLNRPLPGKIHDGRDISIRNIMEEEYGRVVDGSSKNLYMFWPAQKNDAQVVSVQLYSLHSNGQPLMEDRHGTLWLGTKTYLFQITSPLSKEYQQLWIHNIPGTNSLLEDSFGMIWAGTDHGLHKFHPVINQFNFFAFPRRTYWSDVMGGSLLEDRTGKIWAATANHDLFVYDPSIPLMTYHEYDWINDRTSSPTIPNQSLNDLMEDRQGRIWVISDWGLSYYDPGKERFYRFDRQSYDGKNPGGVRFYRAIEDKEGLIWLTHQDGLDLYYPETDTFNYFFTNPDIKIDDGRIKPIRTYSNPYNLEAIYQDRQGALWVSYDSNFKLHQIKSSFDDHGNLKIQFEERLPIESNLQPEGIRDIYQDAAGRYWLATTSEKNPGLFMFDPSTGQSRQFTTNDGLLHNSVTSIQEDGHGNIWLLTISGLSKLDPESGHFTNFDEQTGLYIPIGNRNTSSITKTKTGAFLVSGLNGFYHFHPDSIAIQYQAPKIYLTGLQIGGVTVAVGDTSLLQQKLAFTKNITLEPNTRDIAIMFTSLDFVKPENVRYQYRMAGFHDDWIDAGKERTAPYSFLPHGNYTFEVKAMNSNGQWSETPATLYIQVLPPWYQSNLAYLIYLSLFGLLLYALWRYEMKRISLRQAYEMQQFEAQQLQEVDQMKSQFYTNLSHEFRTPMTVILGMADQITQQPKEKLSNIARMIKRNGRNVLHLINQMLDLSKLESGTMTFNFVQGDILQYLRYLTESFQSLAATKEIQMDFYSDLDSLVMDYDPDKMLSIVSNLLSNALKFTPAGGAIVFEVMQQDDVNPMVTGSNAKPINSTTNLKLKVSDNGIGIEKSVLPLIFDRFYQVDGTTTRKGEGTGIGLSLTKELVEKLEGTIEVESTPGEGTELTILLPVKRTGSKITSLTELTLVDAKIASFLHAGALQVQRKTAASVRQRETVIPQSDLPLLLIIEDSPDVIQYLRLCLEPTYHVVTSSNGIEGIKTAIEIVPDIIISDVMMPGKNGFEVCEILKNDERTSHIPIILLTAKAAVEDRLTGLTRGADAYLAKPFDKKELYIRLRKLIQLRQTLQKRYNKAEIANPATDFSQKIEDLFVTKLKDIINKNIDNHKLGPDFLCKKMGLSHAQLYRKVKALTGKSVSIYIRSLRLHKSKNLLLSTNLNISEIAYEVGFNNPSRLSEYFKAEYGLSPSEWRIQQSK